jgi:hypothetical protein
MASGTTPMMKAIDRHEDGAQSQAACLQHRRHRIQPFGLLGPRELDDKDRILRRQPDEHDEADLGEDVVVAPGDPDSASADSSASGTISSTASGSDQLLYCAARMRNATRTAKGNTRARCSRAFSWYVSSVHS